MTREEIRATIEGLEWIASGESDVVASRRLCRDALTLLRWVADDGDSDPDDIVFEVFGKLDRERKAVADAR